MVLSFFILWALVGWCATVPRPRPRPGTTVSEPVPFPWRLARILGIVGGIAGGLVFALVFRVEPEPAPWQIQSEPVPFPWRAALYAAATSVGAFVGGRILSEIPALLGGGGRAARG